MKVKLLREPKIKYCIWDVGQTIYPYSLSPLNEFCLKKSKNPEVFRKKHGIKAFDFKPFMLGQVNFEQFCKDICTYSEIDFNESLIGEIDEKLKQGVGDFFLETLLTMGRLKCVGITNAILSNALPNLAHTTEGLVATDKAFASFELGLLKPDERIFKTVLDKLKAKPKEVIFIDNKPKNVEAARNLGVHGIVYHQRTIRQDVLDIICSNQR